MEILGYGASADESQVIHVGIISYWIPWRLLASILLFVVVALVPVLHVLH